MLTVLIRAYLFSKRPSFSLKKYLPIQSMTSSCSENTHGGVILTLSFPENIIFLEKLLF